jgi:hypothetical protein
MQAFNAMTNLHFSGVDSRAGVWSKGDTMTMTVELIDMGQRARPTSHPTYRWLCTLFATLSLLLGGCAVMWVSAYDKDAVDRTTEISKAVLKLYQDLLSTEPNRRKASVAGVLGPKHGEIESLMRLHVLKEQARAKNDESAKVAENLLESWGKFSVNHRSEDSTALSDTTLGIERGILERHLRAAFVAEESKKLGGGTK